MSRNTVASARRAVAWLENARSSSRIESRAGELWIFAYGSLMWNPGFAYVEWAPALIYGYHRALCISSDRWRGTPERPGLVLGLARGGACRGIAFRVAREDVKGAGLDAPAELRQLLAIEAEVEQAVVSRLAGVGARK